MSLDKIYFKNSDNLNIAGLLDQPNSGLEHVVIIIHGNASSKDRSSAKDIATELTKRGVHNLRIDLNGCGESEGSYEDQTITKTVHDADASIDLVKQKGYERISLYGASLGGLTAMAAALNHPELFRLGFKSPVSDWPSFKLAKSGQTYIDEWKKNGYTIHQHSDGRPLKVKYASYEDALCYVMYNKAKTIQTPTLIVHGSEDKEVPISQSERVVKELYNGHLYILAGADHDGQINGDRSKCMDILGDWFEKGILPSKNI